jgi:hypothetical protein
MSSTVKEDAILDLIVTYRERSSMEVAMEFSEWLAGNWWTVSAEGIIGSWHNVQTKKESTTSNLYNLFVKEKSK